MLGVSAVGPVELHKGSGLGRLRRRGNVRLGWQPVPPCRSQEHGRMPGRHEMDYDLAGKCHGVLRRSEEHTSELQSLMRISYAVFCLKKKKHTYKETIYQHRPNKYTTDITLLN